jgi:ankyrin repeat protein
MARAKKSTTTNDTVQPERLVVMRPLSFGRKAGETPDPKIIQMRARQEAANQVLAGAFADTETVIDAAAARKALKAGANVNFPVNELGHTALHIAVQEQNRKLVGELLRAGANTRARDNAGVTPLFYALRARDGETSGILARAEEKPEAQVLDGRHALHEAAHYNLPEAIEALVARGVSPTIRTLAGDSPLVDALKHEALDAAFALAYAGGVQKDMGQAYDDAIGSSGGHDAPEFYVSDFLDAVLGAKPPALPPVAAAAPANLPERETGLFGLIGAGAQDAMESYMKKRPDLDARNAAGDTPLIAALRNKMYGFAETIAGKSDIKAAGNHGQTALHIVAASTSYGSIQMMQRLIELGANVNAKDARGMTPLMAAAHAGQEDAAEVLLEAKAKTDIRDNLGLSAADHARFAQGVFVTDLLGKHERGKKAAATKAFKAAAKKTSAQKTPAKIPKLARQIGKPY